MFTRFSTLRKWLRRTFLLLSSAILCLSTFAPPPRMAPAVRNRNTGESFLPDYGHTLVAAHRTGKSIAPENTLRAVKGCLASESPPDILETDLQITKDGEIVLFHDLYLDEKTDSIDVFGQKRVAVFSKTYAELRRLNMGEGYEKNGSRPYAGLRGDDVPDDLRILRLADMLDYISAHSDHPFLYIIEIKYPFPWAKNILRKLYAILSERQLTDRAIVASYWLDVSGYIDQLYAGKLMRSADPVEIVDFYGCFKRGEDLSGEEIPFMALQLPYYWKNDRLLLANLGQTEFIDYAHRYGISVQYFTVSKTEDTQDLVRGGADVLMTNHPERTAIEIRETELFDDPAEDITVETEDSP